MTASAQVPRRAAAAWLAACVAGVCGSVFICHRNLVSGWQAPHASRRRSRPPQRAACARPCMHACMCLLAMNILVSRHSWGPACCFSPARVVASRRRSCRRSASCPATPQLRRPPHVAGHTLGLPRPPASPAPLPDPAPCLPARSRLQPTPPPLALPRRLLAVAAAAAALTSIPGARAACVANPEHPFDASYNAGEPGWVDLDACKRCDDGNATCLECYSAHGLAANGACLRW